METKYWLMKSEPECYSIDNLAAEPDQVTSWAVCVIFRRAIFFATR